MAEKGIQSEGLTPSQRRFVAKRVKSGDYGSEREVVDRAFSVLEQHERDLRRVRRKIDVGLRQIEHGQIIDGEEAFSKLLARDARRRRRSA